MFYSIIELDIFPKNTYSWNNNYREIVLLLRVRPNIYYVCVEWCAYNKQHNTILENELIEHKISHKGCE